MQLKRLLFILLIIAPFFAIAQKKKEPFKVVAYFSTDSTTLHTYDFSKVTHLIYGFGHVSNGDFIVIKPNAIATLQGFQKIKAQKPGLKTMIALGGWGGCEFCSQTFNDKELTKKFAESVKKFLDLYGLDGIDLDWEYPTIPGPPGHQYLPEDKDNFTNLIIELRKALGKNKLITFAAGGFQNYFNKSVDWKALEPYIDFVNIMSYDLVHGYSTRTGHHTPLYSTGSQLESTHNGINFFKKINFPLKKLIVGCGFYSREFSTEDTLNNGLYRPAKFTGFVDYNKAVNKHTPETGFQYFWDNQAKAAYWFNKEKKIFVTGDTKESVSLKSKYVRNNKLGGIMFWELPTDLPKGGLLGAISVNP